MIDIKKILGNKSKFTKPLNTQIFSKTFNTITSQLNKEINIRNIKSEDNSEKIKTQLLTPIFQEINQILSDKENPLKALRKSLIEAIDELAFFEVLLPASKVLVHTSGDLHQYLETVLKNSEKLQEDLKPYGISHSSLKIEIENAIKKHIKTLSLRVKSLNITRKEMGDYNRDRNKDWFSYCFLSFSVFHEEIIRQCLNLNSIMIGKDKEQRLNIYSSWHQLATFDDKDLFTSWEELLDMHHLKNIFDLTVS